jgi:8-oxo-dGTP pyrophosphatase MutT (NUDIX family)
MSTPEVPTPELFAMGTSTYARRDGELLILKRALGAMSGSWYLPGGGLEPGETLEACAVRELYEESGLEPTGPLSLIGLVRMNLYGHEMFVVSYACDCDSGDVKLSNEHSDFRWIAPQRFRDDFFSDEQVARVVERSARVGTLTRGLQKDLDDYLGWLDREKRLR